MSAFDTKFKKDEKPGPKILKVSPIKMAKFGIKKLNLISACFNENVNQKESFIMA